jgi:hypothetical protein
MRRSLLLLFLMLSGCQTVTTRWRDVTHLALEKETPPQVMVRRIEQAHGAAAWKTKQAVSADVSVQLDGRDPLTGPIAFTTDAKKARLPDEFPDDASAILNRLPALAAVPAMLRDPTSVVTDAGTLPFGGRDVPVLRLTFAPGSSHAGGDYYVLYPDPETGRLRAIAFIPSVPTTAPTPAAAAATSSAIDARAVTFSDWTTVDGVPLPTRWTFFRWTIDAGITGDPLAIVVLWNPRFVAATADLFDKSDAPATEAATSQAEPR